jgi:hypothetical protein
MKFRLLERDARNNKIGSHRIGNKKYKAGDVLESNRPLDTIFRGKFVRLTDQNTPVSKPEIVKLPKLNARNQIEVVAVAGGEGQTTESSPPSLDGSGAVKKTAFGHEESYNKPTVPAKSEHGVNVTDEFPDAELAAMKIYHNIKTDSYIVVDGKSEEILKRVKSDKLVVKFLKSQFG